MVEKKYMVEIMFILIVIVLSVLCYIVYKYMNETSVDKLIHQIDEMQSNGDDYFIICPECGNRVYLKKVQIYKEDK